MPKVEEFQLHPLGWENDPEEERYRLSTLDYLTTITYTNTAVFFKLEEADKVLVISFCLESQHVNIFDSKAAATLKEGLERTFSQIRHLVGTIERDEDGHHSIVRKKNSTVLFVIKHLDTTEDNFPSFTEIANAHFLSPILGDVNVLSNSPMTCGNKPEAHPDNSPAVSSFRANIIPGGLIFHIQTHHYSNGLSGATAFYRQLAGNCYAITHNTPYPSFDLKCLDRSIFNHLGLDAPSTPTAPQTEAPPRANRNTQHKHSQLLLFHLPKSKAKLLKAAAAPPDKTRISTYSAVCALLWRVLSRLREPLYNPGLNYKPLWAEGVSISKLYTNPPIPTGMQGNLQFDISSRTSPIPELTLGEIISPTVPLSRLATYTRKMTDSVTPAMLRDVLAKFAHVRNKHDLSIRVESFPPLALLFSDWRYSDLCGMDFGFARPDAYRHLFGGVPLCQAVVYPPRVGPAGEDEGMEVQFTFETELVPALLRDEEWGRYFEFRGVDGWEEGGLRAKL
jgi:hypothetical protein